MHADAFRNAIRSVRRITRNRPRSLEAITRIFSGTVFRSWFNDCWFYCMNYYVAFMERNLCAGWMSCRKMAFSIEEQHRYYDIQRMPVRCRNASFLSSLMRFSQAHLRRKLRAFSLRSFPFFFLHNFFSLSLLLSRSFVRSFINNKCVSLKNIVLTK